jgi:hypothetical protein
MTSRRRKLASLISGGGNEDTLERRSNCAVQLGTHVVASERDDNANT